MQKFKGAVGNSVGFIFFGLMSLSLAVVASIAVGSRPASASEYRIVIPMCLFFYSGGLYMLVFAWEVMAVYLIDDEGITKRRGYNVQRLAWRNLADFETAGGTSINRLTLIEDAGKRLQITLGFLKAFDCWELSALLEPRLAPLHAKKMREIEIAGQTFRTDWHVAILLLIPTTLFSVVSLTCLDGQFCD